MNLTQIRIIIIHTYNALTHSVASSLLHYFQFFCFFIHSKVIITHTQKETAILLILFSSFAHQPPFSHFFTSHNFPLCKKRRKKQKNQSKALSHEMSSRSKTEDLFNIKETSVKEHLSKCTRCVHSFAHKRALHHLRQMHHPQFLTLPLYFQIVYEYIIYPSIHFCSMVCFRAFFSATSSSFLRHQASFFSSSISLN